MKQFKPLVVSVIIPVHNVAKFLPDCLTSIKNQTYQDIQIIAIDDCSTDESLKTLQLFRKHYKKLEIYRNKKKYGLAVCYNRAIKVAKGQFIAFMNPHDMSSANRLKRQINFLLKNPKTVAVGTQYTSIDENNRKLERSNLPQENEDIYEQVIQASSLHPETVMINRERLPKDVLHFKATKYPFIFTEVFLKFFRYGAVANIVHSLYYHREIIKRNGKKISRKHHIATMLKLWFSSKTYNTPRPSFRSFLPHLVREI
jgi:glycosyltransferase involved in cell wall biosynthesis